MIYIEYPSIDEAEFEGNPVLRGVIKQSCLPELRIDHAYQREFLSETSRRYIMDALVRQQRLPDIELGMRGESWQFDPLGEDIVTLKDPVFIIDGQQRRGTILEYIANNENSIVRQGALVHFNTTMEWERERFHALNLHQTRVAGTILLRNLRSTNVGIATLYGLATSDKEFPLRNRISWGQYRDSKDLLTATLYARMVLLVHGHLGGGIIASGVPAMAQGFERLTDIIGLPTLRENTKTFWLSIEEIWGISNLSRHGAPWLKNTFLASYANTLSDHKDFWKGNKLVIDKSLINKLKRFPINDPEIKILAGSSGAAHTTLEFHLAQWLNKYQQKMLFRRADPAYEHKAKAARESAQRQKGKPRVHKPTNSNAGISP